VPIRLVLMAVSTRMANPGPAMHACNKHNPEAILALFMDDADWVNVAGSWWPGSAH
jgi:hypothetical protein